jgi:hypothetical protein
MVNKEEWESSALHKAVTEMAFLTPWKFFVLPSHSQNKGGTFQKRQENRRKKLLPKQDPDLSVTNMQNCMNEQRRNPYRGRNEYNFADVVDVLNNSFFFSSSIEERLMLGMCRDLKQFLRQRVRNN